MSRTLLTLKLIILQCALGGGLLVGSWIARHKGSTGVSLKSLKHIIINRSDRIGDAILSAPLIEIYIEELRACGYDGDITLLSSELNDFVLRPLEKHAGVRVEISPVILPEYVSGISSLLKKIKNRLFSLFLFRPDKPLDTTTLLLDFMANGDAAVPLYYKKQGNPIIYGLNALTSTILYDRSLPRALVHHSKDNLIETYLELLTRSIEEMGGLRARVAREFDERFYPTIEALYPEVLSRDFDALTHGREQCIEWSAYYLGLNRSEQETLQDSLRSIHRECLDSPKKKKSILIFVGAYSHRSLPIATWGAMIRELSESLSDYRITLMDGPEDTILRAIQETHDLSNLTNIRIEPTILPLKLFALYTSKHSHVIGLDGGGINFVRRFSHSLSIFTFANPLVWRAYAGSKRESVIRGAKGWYLRYFCQDQKSISHMAKNHPLLPTFNISEAKIFLDDLDTQIITEWVRSTEIP